MRGNNYWLNAAYDNFIPTNADVVIIGAGIAGISTAYWLYSLNKKQSIIVLDNGPYAGHNGSGSELGMILYCGGFDYQYLVDSLGEYKAKLFLTFIRNNNQLIKHFIITNEIPCCYQQGGGLYVTDNPDKVESLIKTSKSINSLGIPAVTLAESELQTVLPSNRLYGGIYVPNEAIVNPYIFMSNVIDKLRTGTTIRFYYSTKVVSVSNKNILLDNGHNIEAKYIIHTNGSTPNLEYIIPSRDHLIATEDLPENISNMFPCMPITINNQSYFRMYNNTLISLETGIGKQSMIRNNNSYNVAMYQKLATLTARVFPITSVVGNSNVWTSISHGTPDCLPLVGELPSDSQQFVISGLGSHRFSFAFLAGRLIANIITQGKKKTGAIAKSFSPERFVNNAF